MAVLPTPTGAPTLPSEATGSTYNEAYFQALFTKQWGTAAGNAYATYNKNNPQNSAYVNAENFLQIVVAEGLANGIKTAISTSGTALGQIPGAAAQGATNAYKTLASPGQFYGSVVNAIEGLSKQSTWIRVVKVLVGSVLLISGIVHMTGVDKTALGVAGNFVLPAKVAKAATG
jgi:hypothetical protein